MLIADPVDVVPLPLDVAHRAATAADREEPVVTQPLVDVVGRQRQSRLPPAKAQPGLMCPAAAVTLETLDSWETGPSPPLGARTAGGAESAMVAPFVTIGAGVGQDFWTDGHHRPLVFVRLLSQGHDGLLLALVVVGEGPDRVVPRRGVPPARVPAGRMSPSPLRGRVGPLIAGIVLAAPGWPLVEPDPGGPFDRSARGLRLPLRCVVG